MRVKEESGKSWLKMQHSENEHHGIQCHHLMARRDKKDFLNDKCKDVEESNRMGETRDLFKKIRDTKGTFHAKMSSTKDGNGIDLTEAEDIMKRWQEYRRTVQKRFS